jgi:hypothetical protein
LFLDRNLQQGDGATSISTPKHIIIHEETSKYYDLFKLQGLELRVSVLPPEHPNTDVYSWLDGVINELHQHLTGYARPTDYIGLTISSESFVHGPL